MTPDALRRPISRRDIIGTVAAVVVTLRIIVVLTVQMWTNASGHRAITSASTTLEASLVSATKASSSTDSRTAPVDSL